ncbi:MAG: RluA family pseudouridine synthase [Fuerstiella sp.]
MNFEFIVQPADHGRRIDAFLARHLRNHTSWRLHRLVGEGLAFVDGLPCEMAQRVFRGQAVQIRLVEAPDKLLEAECLAFDVLYEDPWMLVVNKPAGMVAHPIGQFQSGTLCNGIQHRLDCETVAVGLLRPGIVHRLDRMTSGLLMVAKTAEMHTGLSTLIQNGLIEKQYLALVQGQPSFDTLMIDKPIGAVPGSSILMSVAADCRSPRSAKTDVRVLQQLRTSSLVQCRLHTGRNHQIRVHLASVGHPVIGDEFYLANNAVNEKLEVGRDLTVRHSLHASVLQFQHPVMKHIVTVRCSPPSDFWQTVES